MRFAEMLMEPNKEDTNEPDHECDGDADVDCDICASCKEHSGFCTECGLSECCGESPVRS
jgi:hypothetical protein